MRWRNAAAAAHSTTAAARWFSHTASPLLSTSPSASPSSLISRPPFLFLSAPLEDVSSSAFRRLMYLGGADLAFSEMARVENLARKASGKTGTTWGKLAHHHVECGPTSVQLLVGNEESLRQFLQAFEPTLETFAGFNLNLGCPSPQMMSLGLGAQAIKRIAKTQRHVEALNEFIARKCSGPEWKARAIGAPTVSLKMRLGANEREKKMGAHINLIKALNGTLIDKRPARFRKPEPILTASTEGAASISNSIANTTAAGSSALPPSTPAPSTTASSGIVSHFIVHGRHGKEHYDAPNDFSAVHDAIEATGAHNIIANGDVHTLEQVLRCREMGAAGVMIGRAAVKNPMIFSQLKRALLQADPTVTLLHPPQPDLTPAQLRERYLSFAAATVTPAKYIQNVSARIGEAFLANPKVQLSERVLVERQGRAHPRYEEVVQADRQRPRWTPDKKKGAWRLGLPLEQQLQESVQG